jgi:ABC-type lipoprotein release transport system permease subunit
VLFELQGYDPVAIVTSVVLLALVALGAAYVPARRASRVDPMQALRYE